MNRTSFWISTVLLGSVFLVAAVSLVVVVVLYALHPARHGAVSMLLELESPETAPGPPAAAPPEPRGAAEPTREAAEVVRRRLESFGVPKPELRLDERSPNRFRIEAPAAEPAASDAFLRLFEKPGVLELRLVEAGAATAEQLLEQLGGVALEDAEIVCEREAGEGVRQCYSLAGETVIDGRDVVSARPGRDDFDQPVVYFLLHDSAGERFREFTAANLGRQLAILVDGRLLSAPLIHGEIGVDGVIQGAFAAEEADELATILRSGALPAPVRLVETEPISGARWLRTHRLVGGICLAVLAVSGAFILIAARRYRRSSRSGAPA